MLIPLPPDQVEDHDVIVDVEVRHIYRAPDGERHIDPFAESRASFRMRIPLDALLAADGYVTPAVRNEVYAKLGELGRTVTIGPET